MLSLCAFCPLEAPRERRSALPTCFARALARSLGCEKPWALGALCNSSVSLSGLAFVKTLTLLALARSDRLQAMNSMRRRAWRRRGGGLELAACRLGGNSQRLHNPVTTPGNGHRHLHRPRLTSQTPPRQCAPPNPAAGS